LRPIIVAVVAWPRPSSCCWPGRPRAGRSRCRPRRRAHQRCPQERPIRWIPGRSSSKRPPPDRRTPTNRVFELCRNHLLLDSGSFIFSQPDLRFSFQGSRGGFVIIGSHLVVHEPVRYLDWTWREGTDDYAHLAASGKAQFIAPNLERYGVLGRLTGTIRNLPPGSASPSQR
jgi:hypothetical protein